MTTTDRDRGEAAARGEIDRMGSDLAALGSEPPDRMAEAQAGEISVLVLHSSTLVAAGLVASLSRLTSWLVRIPDASRFHAPWPEHLRDVDVVITDAEWMASRVQDEAFRLRGCGRHGPRFVLVSDQPVRRAQGVARAIGVAGRLSVHCTEEELVQVVQGAAANLSNARSPVHRAADAPRGGLAPVALRRVQAYVEQRLAGKIELGDLAAIAGLSDCHFSRAFKESTGLPPHRYLMMRRIAVAAELVASTERTITEISQGSRLCRPEPLHARVHPYRR
jgi:AraC-like DNA-binding protein